LGQMLGMGHGLGLGGWLGLGLVELVHVWLWVQLHKLAIGADGHRDGARGQGGVQGRARVQGRAGGY